jgi:hypothetical protein
MSGSEQFHSLSPNQEGNAIIGVDDEVERPSVHNDSTQKSIKDEVKDKPVKDKKGKSEKDKDKDKDGKKKKKKDKKDGNSMSQYTREVEEKLKTREQIKLTIVAGEFTTVLPLSLYHNLMYNIIHFFPTVEVSNLPPANR